MAGVSRAIVVDANIVISAVVPSNATHGAALALLGEHADEDKYLHRPTLAEVPDRDPAGRRTRTRSADA
jgi:hypothetical protein